MIQLGDTLPDGILYHIDAATRILHILSIRHLFAHKRVLLLGVPGAYTPSCRQVPGCCCSKLITLVTAVNDPFVTHQWSKTFADNNDAVRFLADGSATFTKALGMDIDLTRHGMGVRGRRFVLFADNLRVRKLIVEYPGEAANIAVDDVLKLFI
ncbi:peroxiredoxin-2 [Selaginella moellendorffii]|uniref:peroxiredoxin-2 n=1 Tax=Selaginella moellendorffii TaxID=88036 RepID=UPI000D1CF8F4|nr:peroxiredoxin-2 [Selaginella moellendorffii]XP_024523107.1 peroxiredoxin-2 [Selaginella moellendorffii]|eukprot:XP_024522169.1 peroxiredoxin-2 [Selaginella moellendorffii]